MMPLTHREAENEIRRLRREYEHIVNRLAAACEVLGKVANREKLTCRHCGQTWRIGGDDGTAN